MNLVDMGTHEPTAADLDQSVQMSMPGDCPQGMMMTEPGHAAPGFFYSTGYYPFGHVTPAPASLAYYHYSPILLPVYQPVS